MLAIVTRYPRRRHLAQNPFVCDCNLKWLADFLRANPIETSGARCASPRRLANKRIGQIKSKKFRCSGEHHPCHLQGLWPNLCCAYSGADVLFLSAAKEQYFIPGKGGTTCVRLCVCIWCRLLYPGQMSPWIMFSYGPSFVHTEGYGHALGTSWGVGGPSQLQPRYSALSGTQGQRITS